MERRTLPALFCALPKSSRFHPALLRITHQHSTEISRFHLDNLVCGNSGDAYHDSSSSNLK